MKNLWNRHWLGLVPRVTRGAAGMGKTGTTRIAMNLHADENEGVSGLASRNVIGLPGGNAHLRRAGQLTSVKGRPCIVTRARAVRSIVLLALVGVAMLAPAYGQEFRASITGQVADTNGAVIPGATITAVNKETRVSASTKTNGNGNYSLLYLLPGTYTVTVAATNFQTTIYNNVRLDSAQQLGMNVNLKPGSVTQQVVVSAGAVDLDTVTATTGGVIDQLKVENMPSAGLMVFDDVVLTQGIVSTDMHQLFNLTPRNNTSTYSAAGEQDDENAFYVNGAPVSDQGTWYFTPSQAAVQQMQASSMPYDAEYGRTGGGAFNTNVKDGTNAFHGAVYDYYGNSALNANTWVADLTGIRKPINTRNTWGAMGGGPIRKDKTFYFGSYEQFLQHEPAANRDTVPTAGELSGNFNGTGFTVYDPTSTYCATKNSSGGCTTYGRTEFPNDTIPPGDISAIGKAILSYYPAPNNSAITDNYVTTWPTRYGYRQFMGRVDQSFSQNTRMYGLFLYQYDNEATAGNGFNNAAWTGTIPTGTDYNIVLDLTHIFSATKVVDLKASYGHDSSITTTGDAIQEGLTGDKLGLTMPAVATTSHQNIVPSFTVTGATALFGNTSNGTADADADFSGSITQLLGRHSLHYGGEFEDIQKAPTGVLGDPNGTFTFNSVYTQENPNKAVTGQGNEFADILLGYPSSGSLTWNEPTFVTMHYFGGFIQDDYKALPTLSINLGVRWDVNTSPRDRRNRINAGFCLTCTNPITSQVNFAKAPDLQSPLLGGLQFAGVNGQPSAPFQVHWNDWQPRVGFSWEAMRDTVIRGGYGLYFPWAPLDVDDIGFSQTTSFVASLNGALNPDTYFNSGTPYPSGAIAPAGASAGLETNAGNAITFNDLNRRLRLTQHWSFGVQRKLPAGVLLDIEYLGTQVQHIPINTPLGVVSTSLQQQCLADLSICNTNVSNPFYGVLATSTSLGASSTIPAYELMRGYPLFNGVTEDRLPTGSSHYNSLTVRAERRVKSFDFVFNYAYSDWMDRDSYLNDSLFISPTHPIEELDPSDVRHFLDTNLALPVPGIKGGGVLGYLTNGWLFDSTVAWATGLPLELPNPTVTGGGANFNYGAPGCTSLAPPGGQTRAHWFNNNTACWSSISTWEPQTTPAYVGFLRAPVFFAWDPSVNRIFPLHREGTYIQFRMEALNGANHPVFAGPSDDVALAPAFTSSTSWTGLGTLPNSQTNQQRQIFPSLKIVF